MQGYFSLVLHAHLPFVRHPEHKKFLDAAKQAAKESGLDDAAAEKLLATLRPKMDAQFESWQVDLCGDEATGKLGRLDELDKAAWELSEQKKSQL